jgi:hypothetical protein
MDYDNNDVELKIFEGSKCDLKDREFHKYVWEIQKLHQKHGIKPSKSSGFESVMNRSTLKSTLEMWKNTTIE